MTAPAVSQPPISSTMDQALQQALKHHRAGEFQDAERLYRAILQAQLNHPDANHNLGVLAVQMKQPAAGLPHFKAALEANPGQGQYWLSYIEALIQAGQQDAAREVLAQGQAQGLKGEAVEALAGRLEGATGSGKAPMQKAAELLPGDAEGCNNLGTTFLNQDRFTEAEASYRRALELKPDFAYAHNNLGVALKNQGRLAEAEASFRWALALKPDFVMAHSNLGNTLQDQGRLTEAEASYRQALALKPDFAWAHNNLGNALQDQGWLTEAETSFRQALALKPDFAWAHNNLANTLQMQGRLTEAEASYRQALALKPDFTYAHSHLLFALNYHPDRNGEEVFAVYREYDARFGLPHRGQWRPHSNSCQPRRRLKVGYVSPDFYKHSVRHFLEPLLAHHNKKVVEVYAYAESARVDEVTERYKRYVDHWVPTLGLTDDALAERIRADGIDILVELAGHTAKNRLPVFARKPAPVSVSWLGYGYTTGLTAIDYYLTDAASAPAGSEPLFAETPWRLATSGYVYRPAEGMGKISPLPALTKTKGHVTFGTLTRAVRINHRTIRVWSAILKKVSGSRLVIDSRNFRDAAMQDTLAEKFAAHGIGRERLEIGCHSPPWEVLRNMDIGLDCFPHNSGTTLFESLYMGVPFVTLQGRPSVGRLGSMILEGVGHPEWIAGTEDEYVELASALASDLAKLAALRAGLRDEMKASPLMDEPGFAHKVEKAYRDMWRRYCEGEKIVAN